MERVEKYINDVANIIQVDMPYSESTDIIQIRLTNLTTPPTYWNFDDEIFEDTLVTGTTGTMDYVTGSTFGDISTFTTTFTPPADGTYNIKMYNVTKGTSPYIINATSSGEETTTISAIEGDGRTQFELFNLILDALGEPRLAAFPATFSELEDAHKEIYSFMNTWQRSVATNGTLWIPLVQEGTITLVDGQTEYDVPTNLNKLNKDSFIYTTVADGQKRDIQYQEFDKRNQFKLVTYGQIETIYVQAGKFVINKAPSGEAGNTITYKYYAIPSDLSVDEPNRKTWFPSGYDWDVFAVGVLAEITRRRMQAESSTYYALLNGDRSMGILSPRGSLFTMKKNFSDSNHISIDVRGV